MRLLPITFFLPIALIAQDIPAERINSQYAALRYAEYKVTKQKYFRDQDGDGFGNRLVFVVKYPINKPAGYVSDSTDCDDSSAFVHPGATELCNGVDDNCDGDPLNPATCSDNTVYLTNTGHLIDKDLFSGDLEDCWFKGGQNTMIDIFGDQYFFARLKDIGFGSLMYGNGSQNHAYRVDPEQPQDGYYCGPWVQEGNVNDVCDDVFGVDFFRLSVEMADSLGVPLNFIYNSEYGDTIQAGYMIQQGHSTFVGECTECNNWPNSYTTAITLPNGGEDYRKKEDSTINKFLDRNHPDIKKGGDNNPPDKLNEWDIQVVGMNVDAFRMYLFDSMFMPDDIGDNFSEYLLTMDYAFENLLPAVMDSFKIHFPGYKLALYEVGLNNSDPMPWYNTQMANLYLVKWYSWALKYNLDNDDFINTMVYKSIRSLSLSKQVVKNHFYGLKQIGQVFSGDTLVTIQTSIAGVYGMGSIGADTIILLANDNDADVTFQFEGHTSISGHVVWADALNSTAIQEAETGTSIILKRNSITVFKL